MSYSTWETEEARKLLDMLCIKNEDHSDGCDWLWWIPGMEYDGIAYPTKAALPYIQGAVAAYLRERGEFVMPLRSLLGDGFILAEWRVDQDTATMRGTELVQLIDKTFQDIDEAYLAALKAEVAT